MKFRRLGKSDLTVSEIALGSWLTYSGGVERRQAEACLKAAFDAGINFIDTANVYGRGASEQFLGETLAGLPRHSYVLATKVYFPMSSSDKGLSRAQILKQIDDSLRRLRTDFVDLYQCHRYDSETPLDETMEALTQVVKQGKARYVGFSEWSAPQIEAAMSIKGAVPFVSSQPQYSMLWREPEKEVFPTCAKHQIGQIVWSPLAQGVLTGKYLPGQPKPQDSRAASSSMGSFMDDAWLLNDRVLNAVQRLRPIAQKAGLTMVQLALAWVLRQEIVSSAIIGASKPEQVRDNAKASGISLSPEILTSVDEVLQPALALAEA